MVTLAALAGPASAEPAAVRALPLPSRRDPGALRARTDAVAAALAAKLELPVATAAAGETEPFTAGIALASRGELDAAARLLDPVLEDAARAPHRAGDPELLIAAHVARAAIALARDERRRADRIFERLLAYDPGFALAAAERSPRARAAVAAARERAGAAARLRIALLGNACEDVVLVVARRRAPDITEVSRFDDCRLVAAARASASQTAAEIAAALDPIAAQAPPPIYRRPWFLIGAAAVVAAGGVAVFFAVRDDPELTVTPHF